MVRSLFTDGYVLRIAIENVGHHLSRISSVVQWNTLYFRNSLLLTVTLLICNVNTVISLVLLLSPFL